MLCAAGDTLPSSWPARVKEQMQAETSLKIKSYFAPSVEQAIQEARRELGQEAVLITARRSALEASHRGAYEVVFGVPVEVPNPPSDSQDRDMSREIARLRDQLENIKRLLQPDTSNASAGVQQELAAAGLDEDLIRSLVKDIDASDEIGAIESILKRLQFAPQLTSGAQDSRRVIAFVGPPGAGKTTTLAKIAMRECLGRRVSVRVISVETHRAAAHEKLRSLARIMGFGFTAANSMRELIEAVDEFRGKDILLIDTPGFSRNDFDAARNLIRFLTQVPQKEIHLVLPASMNRDDLMACYRRYSDFQPDYVLFTKLDETESRSGVLSVALESNKPISFVTTGQNIPEDIDAASAPALLGRLFKPQTAAVVSAA